MKILFLGLSLLVGTSAFATLTSFEGRIVKVVPEKKEIYVEADGKKHELYFKENTKLLQNGEAAEFSILTVDQKVKVEAKKVGKRLDPVTVEVLN